LDEIVHPLLAKTAERFADDQTPQERISAIDDEVLFKVKVQRWRGAVWIDEDLARLIAAGKREEGSPEDFYAALAARGNAARARYNAEHSPPLSSATYSGYLLPGHEDDLRWRAEAAARAERSLIPGCQSDAWMSDYAMPERAVAPEEQIWSNIMDPAAAAKLLD
jgi:hypothetical protein